MSDVLIVDDSPADRALFRTILGRAGLTVDEAATGHEALEKAPELNPHVIVLDVNLPDTDGYALCRTLRADPRFAATPVLILTVRHGDEEVRAGLLAGADDYLAKDAPVEVIQARIRRLANYSRMASVTRINEQLAQVGRLLAGIIHEIRGPLTVIRGNAELLGLHTPEGSPSHQWIEPILRNTRLLQVRLDHLMATVRGGPPALRSMELLPLVTESCELFRKGLDPRRGAVRVEVQSAAGLPLVRVDPGRLIQVVLNLLGNAHEAIVGVKGAGLISVDVDWVEADGLEVRVRDDGPGIPATHLERIFEPFFTTKVGGSGYGLYLAREILREHGGALTASNAPDGGACFTLRLPVASESDETSA